MLQAYDELVVGYTVSRYLGDPRAAEARAAFGDRDLPTGIVMLVARVAGHSRQARLDGVLTKGSDDVTLTQRYSEGG